MKFQMCSNFLLSLCFCFVFLWLCNSQKAPENFQVTFSTTVNEGTGKIVLNITRSYSPHGVDRFYELLTLNSSAGGCYYNQNSFFRIVPNFVVQFGINGNPQVSNKWEDAYIRDDPVVISNLAGTIAYADAGPNTRTTQLYINYVDNRNLDKLGFTPFGKIISGMDVALNIFSGYGETPNQDLIYSQGNPYLKQNFPKLDYIVSAQINK